MIGKAASIVQMRSLVLTPRIPIATASGSTASVPSTSHRAPIMPASATADSSHARHPVRRRLVRLTGCTSSRVRQPQQATNAAAGTMTPDSFAPSATE